MPEDTFGYGQLKSELDKLNKEINAAIKSGIRDNILVELCRKRDFAQHAITVIQSGDARNQLQTLNKSRVRV